MSRPLVVTVTCWVIIALSIEVLFGHLSGASAPSLDALLAKGNPIDPSRAAAIASWTALLFPGFSIALASLMLSGANWARLIYTAALAIGAVGVGIYLFRAGANAPLLWFGYWFGKNVLFMFLLFSRSANEYFSPPIRAA